MLSHFTRAHPHVKSIDFLHAHRCRVDDAGDAQTMLPESIVVFHLLDIQVHIVHNSTKNDHRRHIHNQAGKMTEQCHPSGVRAIPDIILAPLVIKQSNPVAALTFVTTPSETEHGASLRRANQIH